MSFKAAALFYYFYCCYSNSLLLQLTPLTGTETTLACSLSIYQQLQLTPLTGTETEVVRRKLECLEGCNSHPSRGRKPLGMVRADRPKRVAAHTPHGDGNWQASYEAHLLHVATHTPHGDGNDNPVVLIKVK